MKSIQLLSAGNMGALSFLMELNQPHNYIEAGLINPVLERSETLKGTNLYVLFSDLCDRNIVKVAHLCQVCPLHLLEDACSRQDYSGRELLKNYLK